MGNQNAVSVAIDVKESPMNYLQRLAYAFCAGDMLTVILRGNGDMILDWGTSWENDTPDQENIISLVKNLIGWRLDAGKDFLVYGRMLKPLPFEGVTNFPMISKPGRRAINFPSVFTSNWQSDGGRKSQFFVNYLPDEQAIILYLSEIFDVRVSRYSSDKQGEVAGGNELKITLNPLSAIMVTYIN